MVSHMSKPNIIIFDIETTDFNADKGELLCVGYKRLGEGTTKLTTVLEDEQWFSQKSGIDDRALLKRVYGILSAADGWIAHNGRGFDEKFLNTRLAIQGMSPLPPIPMVDTYLNILRGGTKLSSRRLGKAAASFGLAQAKDSLPWSYWLQARRGYEPAVRRIGVYCKQDIRVTEALYLKVRNLCKTHHNFSLLNDDPRPACPICGSFDLQSRGISVRRTGKDRRYHCQSCGGWSRAPIGPKKEGRLR